MFGDLVVWYLFLGGVSAGATLVALGMRWRARSCGGAWAFLDRGVFQPLVLLALLALVMGCVCLLGDLRRPQAAHLLLIAPTLSIINVGALLLVGLLCTLVALVVLDGGAVRFSRRPTWAVEVLAGVLALAVATYTGVYLHSFWTILPWGSLLLVVLFVLSSLSTGFACAYLAVSVRVSSLQGLRRQLAQLERADALVIAAEALVLVAMLAHSALRAGAGSAEGLSSLVNLLLSGELAVPFLLGFAGCALVVPPLLAAVGLRLGMPWRPRLCVQAAALLVGGFALRYCIIEMPVLYKAALLAAL